MSINDILSVAVCIVVVLAIGAYFFTIQISMAMVFYYIVTIFYYIKKYHPDMFERLKPKKYFGMPMDYAPIAWPEKGHSGFSALNYIRFGFSDELGDDKKLSALKKKFRIAFIAFWGQLLFTVIAISIVDFVL